MNEYVVRLAAAEDNDAIQALFASAISQADWLPESARSATDLASVTQDELILVCTTSSGSIVGFASMYAPDRFLHHLFAAPGWERNRVGSALIAGLQHWVKPPWRLKCLIANERALAFYSHTGWLEVLRSEGPEGQYALLEKQ